MKLLVLISIFLFLTPVYSDINQREIENKAIDLVIKKYGKGLSNRLKGTGLEPSYRSWYENDCFVSIASGTFQESSWIAMEWFSVNVCSKYVRKLEAN
tara:strand:- start:840 stop:1133 length:294 start_codon:yes stop_codon:yes gene_type:complete